jgi:hypothetical protein
VFSALPAQVLAVPLQFSVIHAPQRRLKFWAHITQTDFTKNIFFAPQSNREWNYQEQKNVGEK